MKALILTINDNILNGLAPNGCASNLASSLFSKGVEVVANNVIASTEHSVLNTFNNLPDVNTIIIFGEFDAKKNLHVKELVCKFLKDDLVENAFAINAISAYYKKFNLPMDQTTKSEAMIPRDSKPIANLNSYQQGFVTYKNGRHIIFLPNDLHSLRQLYPTWIEEFIKAKFPKLSMSFTLKTFGLTKPDALVLLGDLLKNKNQIKLVIYPNDLELSIIIKYSALTPIEDIDAYVNNVKTRLNNFIYAEYDESLFEVAFSLLKQNNMTIAVAESITGGNIVSNLIKNNEGISKFLTEGITSYSDMSKINRLGVSVNTLTKHTAVSAEIAYEMAAGLLEKNEEADFVLATTGHASPQAEDTGLVFLAVGNYDGIHIYKNKFNGSRQKIIDSATKAGIFYLIKKIKQNM
jgi:nicotinamide-nucleotide amidase